MTLVYRSPSVPSPGVIVALCIGLLAVPGMAGAQDRIEPAPAIRVVQSRDPVSGEIARWVIENPSPAEVLRIQVELARAGFDPRIRSGMLDGPTRQALSAFQTARGILICGCLTYETILALGIRPQVVDFAAARTGGGYAARSGASNGDPGLAYDSYSQVIVVAPGFFAPGVFHPHHRRHFPAVVVGHEPVIGAGQLDRRPPPVSVGVRGIRPLPPQRSRPGGSIRIGPRPPRPIPRY